MPVSLFSLAGQEGADIFAEANMAILRRVRDFEWSSTAAGAVADWPGDLRSACRAMLLSATPMAVLIGPEGVVVHNAAFAPLFDAASRPALGRPIAKVFPALAKFHRNVIADILKGRSCSFRDQPRKVRRAGDLEAAWFDLDFTPIVDESGAVLGALLIGVDTTARMRILVDLQASRERLDLALSGGRIVGTWGVDFASEMVTADERYARLHGVDPELARIGADKAVFIKGIHPEDRDRVMAAFDRAKIDGEYRCQHRVVGADGVRWIIASGRVLHLPEGAPKSFAGIVVDVTEQVETASALAESESRFRTYAETLPHVVFSWDAEGRTTYVNRRWFEFTGCAEGDSKAFDWPAFLHPDDRAPVQVNFRHALETGTPHDAVSRHLHHSGRYRWAHALALPIRNAEGHITSWIGTLTDVHDAKILETEREMVSRELDHRIKNLFALVDGLVRLTARETDALSSFTEQLSGRLAALHRAHGLIVSAGDANDRRRSRSLHDLTRTLLAPYDAAGAAQRIVIEGDDAILDGGRTTAIALILHELATNAAKYGALRSADGRVLVRSRSQDGVLGIEWREEGADVTSPGPFADSFGSRLFRAMTEGQLGGRFHRTFDEAGLYVLIEFPFAADGREG